MQGEHNFPKYSEEPVVELNLRRVQLFGGLFELEEPDSQVLGSLLFLFHLLVEFWVDSRYLEFHMIVLVAQLQNELVIGGVHDHHFVQRIGYPREIFLEELGGGMFE